MRFDNDSNVLAYPVSDSEEDDHQISTIFISSSCSSSETTNVHLLESHQISETEKISNFRNQALMDSATTETRKQEKKPKSPTDEELDDFFTAAERYEQKRFTEKYNYDVVNDTPLEGRYEWIKLKP